MTTDRLEIAFGGWIYRHFTPSIDVYCNILLKRINSIFDDVEGEQRRAADEFMSAAASWYGDDDDRAADAAYDHVRDHILQFMELCSVFLMTGVSPLFHLFEKQLYLHINKELKDWLNSPVNSWQDLAEMIPKFDRKCGQDRSCSDLIDAFRDNDLQELRLVANAVKHGNDGHSYRRLVKNKAAVVDDARIEDDWTSGPYSTLAVNVSVHVENVERYQAAILRFWKLDGIFCASRAAFG